MPRQCARDALLDWENGSRFAEFILDQHARARKLSSADRALAMDLFYGALRHLLLLDRLIDQLRRGKIQISTRCLLRIGLYQLFQTEIPDHAAIFETVAVARKYEKSFVNAILRSAQRSLKKWKLEINQWPMDIRFSHPEFLLRRWTSQYGAEIASAICEWNNRPPRNYARIHPIGADESELNRVRSATQPSLVGDRFPGFFRMEGIPHREWIDRGLIYIQDPATFLSCQLLDPKPGETILDACAAPGGKTALLAQFMNNSGTLIATDSSEGRLDQLRENLSRLRVKHAQVRQLDWLHPSPEETSHLPQFDAILLDLPCSNTGVMRRRVDLRWRLDGESFAQHAAIQSRLLKNCRPYLKPGGRIVYSTCSIEREENESVIAASGVPVEKTVLSLPWKDGFDGAFACLLRP